MTPLSFVRLEQAPDPEDRDRWNVSYQASDDCKLLLDHLGWVWIEQTLRKDLRNGTVTVSVETKGFPPEQVRFARPVVSPFVELVSATHGDAAPAVEDLIPPPPPDVPPPPPLRDPNYRHPKAKR